VILRWTYLGTLISLISFRVTWCRIRLDVQLFLMTMFDDDDDDVDVWRETMMKMRGMARLTIRYRTEADAVVLCPLRKVEKQGPGTELTTNDNFQSTAQVAQRPRYWAKM
jgi:hypothetical protein